MSILKVNNIEPTFGDNIVLTGNLTFITPSGKEIEFNDSSTTFNDSVTIIGDSSFQGDLTISGNLSVTGVTTGNLATYKALLTQLGVQTGNNLNDFNDGLIIGET